jgi:quinol-cytochrome oxidoreductase complex cytochrome b subunit
MMYSHKVVCLEMTLHVHGSSNSLGVSSNADKLPMHPYYLFKDLVTNLLILLSTCTICILHAKRN